MKKEINDIKSYLTYSKGERTALLGVAVIMLILILLVFLKPYMPGREYKTPEDFLEKSDALQRLFHDSVNSADKERFDAQEEDMEMAGRQLFPFDPNKLSLEDWKRLGVSDKLSRTILNYISKGGRFRKKEDLKKIWGMSTNVYNRLEPFIVIKDSSLSREKFAPKTYSKDLAKIDINQADSIDLIMLKGIGPTYATRILNYRKKLGGFTSVSQLKEVYGIDSVLFENLQNRFFVSTGFSPVKISLNTNESYVLARHPYIGRYLAKKIIDSKSKYGPFRELKSLQDRKLIISNDSFERILPYLILWPE